MAGHIVVDIELGDDRVPSSHGKWEMAFATMATSSWLFAYGWLASWQFLKRQSQSQNKHEHQTQAKPSQNYLLPSTWWKFAFWLWRFTATLIASFPHGPHVSGQLGEGRSRSCPLQFFWCDAVCVLGMSSCFLLSVDGGRRKLMEHYPRRGLWRFKGVGRGSEVIGCHRTACFIKIPFPCLVSGPD